MNSAYPSKVTKRIFHLVNVWIISTNAWCEKSLHTKTKLHIKNPSLKHSLPTAAAGSWIYHQLLLFLLIIKLVITIIINIMIVLPHKGKKAITRLLDQLSHHCNSPLWLYTPPSPTTLSLQIHLEIQNRNIEMSIFLWTFLLSVYTVVVMMKTTEDDEVCNP